MEKKRMRLIDANNVIDDIKWEMGETYDDDVRAGMKSVIDIINKRRTAYDVNKVVEELEEIIHPKGLYFCRVSKGGCNKSDDVGCIDCAIQKAIEIVKRGGKNE
jgi:hypothetical protein